MRIMSFMVVALLTIIPSSQSNADIVFEVGASTGNGLASLDDLSSVTGAARANNTNTNFRGVLLASGAASGNNFLFDDVLLTDPTTGVAFTFDLNFTPVTGVTSVSATGAINGSLGEDSPTNTFEDGDIITISVTDINPVNAGDIVNFDGFVQFGTDNSAVGEGFTVNGIDYIRGTATNGNSDPRQGINLPAGTNSTLTGTPLLAQSSVDIESIGTISLRGVAVEFSSTAAVPEPSSIALLSFGVVGLMARRRR